MTEVTAPRIAVLVNPAAGRGAAVVAGTIVAERLAEHGAEVSVYAGNSRAETVRFCAEALAADPDAIVVVGGDGTFSCLLDQLVHQKVPTVLVPAGTGNDVVRALGIAYGSTEAIRAAADTALDGEELLLDIGEANCTDGTAKFLTVAAVGFDAAVAERTNSLRWPKGAARYYLALVIELFRLRPVELTLRIGAGQPSHLPGILAAIANTCSYGGGMPISPDSDPRDGLFDVVHVAPIGRLKLLRLFPLLLKGTHIKRQEVHTWRADSVTVSAPGLVAYADGELVGRDAVEIRMLPAALRMLVPRGESSTEAGVA